MKNGWFSIAMLVHQRVAWRCSSQMIFGSLSFQRLLEWEVPPFHLFANMFYTHMEITTSPQVERIFHRPVKIKLKSLKSLKYIQVMPYCWGDKLTVIFIAVLLSNQCRVADLLVGYIPNSWTSRFLHDHWIKKGKGVRCDICKYLIPKQNLQNRKSYNVPGCVLADPICYTHDCGSKPSPDFRIKMAGSYGFSFPQFRWSPRYWHMLIPTPLDTLWKIASLMGKMIHQIVPNSSDCQAVRSRSPGAVRRFFAKPKNRKRNRTLEPLNLGTCCWVTGLLHESLNVPIEHHPTIRYFWSTRWLL